MGKLFRKIPVIVEAMQFTDEDKNQVFHFVKCIKMADHEDDKPVLKIYTLEGIMIARLGDWIVKGIEGEFYPVKQKIFEKTYEEVTDLKDED